MKANNILVVLTCASMLTACSHSKADNSDLGSLRQQVNHLEQQNAELRQQLTNTQAERDSLDDIIDQVRRYIEDMNY